MSKIYDPKSVICIIGGIVCEGFSENTFIEVTPTEDLHTLTVGNDGNGTFNLNPNMSGSIKLTLKHNSDTVNKLQALGMTRVPVPIVIMDNNEGGQKVVGNECMLQRQIDLSRAKEVGDVDIVWLGEEVLVVPL